MKKAFNEYTVKEWTEMMDNITHHGKYEYRLMEEWEDKYSVELYIWSDIFTRALMSDDGIVDLWNEKYWDTRGWADWCLHIYAYYKDGNITYKGVLYHNLEQGCNDYVELNITENLRVALDLKVKEHIERNLRG